MSNPLKPRPMDKIIAELQRMGWSRAAWTAFRDILIRIDKTLTDKGEVQAVANVTGRTEQLGTTVQHLTSAGQLASADNVAADGVSFGRVNIGALTTNNVDLAKSGVVGKTTDNLSDGTGSPLTGGKRGFVALDTNNRLAASRRNNGLNVSMAPSAATVLSNTGASTVIVIAASTMQMGDGTVSYNSGSSDPGVYGGAYYIYADDPTYAGGAATYVRTSLAPDQVASDGRIQFGTINTVNGVATTGGGYNGGNGKPGGRGFIQ